MIVQELMVGQSLDKVLYVDMWQPTPAQKVSPLRAGVPMHAYQ